MRIRTQPLPVLPTVDSTGQAGHIDEGHVTAKVRCVKRLGVIRINGKTTKVRRCWRRRQNCPVLRAILGEKDGTVGKCAAEQAVPEGR